MGKWLEAAKPVRAAMDKAGTYLTDEQAAEVPVLYREWEVGVSYSAGERRLYDGELYTCLQAHTSQDSWNPKDAPSLWAKVLIPDPDVVYPWKQPDSTNPYMAGDKVSHNGKVWVSDIDYNVWEPGAYGWTEVSA